MLYNLSQVAYQSILQSFVITLKFGGQWMFVNLFVNAITFDIGAVCVSALNSHTHLLWFEDICQAVHRGHKTPKRFILCWL